MMVWWLCGLRLKLVAVRSAVEICPRVLILEGLDHTGVVAPGVVAPIGGGNVDHATRSVTVEHRGRPTNDLNALSAIQINRI